jgi:GlpG protein
LIYLFNSIEQKKLDKTLPYSDFYMTKVQYYLFFDAPYTNEQISAIFQKYDVTTETKLPKAMIRDLNKVMTPAWPGIYNLALAGMLHKTVPVKGIFESIKKWQVWRLFSPTVLHRDFLHILFNMIWLWVLGRQIEERMSLFRYLFLILLLALFTNVAQYLISGPYFMGFSGVITGMAGFIWMRQRIANWEGYTITKGTYYFLLFFVLSMCFLQILSFVLSLLAVKFPVSIANTAHVVGLFLGLLLGKWPFFAWRIVEH